MGWIGCQGEAGYDEWDELDEADFEELDMLCDGVEADKKEEQRKKFKEDMHKKMD